MKRFFLSVVRLVLPVVLVCTLFAMATDVFRAPRTIPAWATSHTTATPYRNVIVVARAGGDFASVQSALNSITDNSSTNRYLVWVAPGTYTETVTMKQYVDIEGAGELSTRIVMIGTPNSATLFGASNAELRYLTVENDLSVTYTSAILNAGVSPSLLHVTAISKPPASNSPPNQRGSSPDIWLASGIRNTNGSSTTMRDVTVVVTAPSYAFCYGVFNGDNSSPTMTNVNISATCGMSGAGVYNANSSATMKDVTVSASDYAVYNTGYNPAGHYSVTIDGSKLRALGSTLVNNPNYTTRVGATNLDGGPVSDYGNPVTCAGVYDENYTFFPNTCP